jgi:hypothetical protein
MDSVSRKIWFSKNAVWQGSPGATSLGTVTMTIASALLSVEGCPVKPMCSLEMDRLTTQNIRD